MHQPVEFQDFPAYLLEQIELARKFYDDAAAMRLRCVQDMERFSQRMKRVQETNAVIQQSLLARSHEPRAD